MCLEITLVRTKLFSIFISGKVISLAWGAVTRYKNGYSVHLGQPRFIFSFEFDPLFGMFEANSHIQDANLERLCF